MNAGAAGRRVAREEQLAALLDGDVEVLGADVHEEAVSSSVYVAFTAKALNSATLFGQVAADRDPARTRSDLISAVEVGVARQGDEDRVVAARRRRGPGRFSLR